MWFITSLNLGILELSFKSPTSNSSVFIWKLYIVVTLLKGHIFLLMLTIWLKLNGISFTMERRRKSSSGYMKFRVVCETYICRQQYCLISKLKMYRPGYCFLLKNCTSLQRKQSSANDTFCQPARRIPWELSFKILKKTFLLISRLKSLEHHHDFQVWNICKPYSTDCVLQTYPASCWLICLCDVVKICAHFHFCHYQ